MYRDISYMEGHLTPIFEQNGLGGRLLILFTYLAYCVPELVNCYFISYDINMTFSVDDASSTIYYTMNFMQGQGLAKSRSHAHV